MKSLKSKALDWINSLYDRSSIIDKDNVTIKIKEFSND